MEPLWSPAVATSGNQWQMPRRPKPRKQAKSVATGCHCLPATFHGKEGVDGSSPSEGFTKTPQSAAFHLKLHLHGVQRDRLWTYSGTLGVSTKHRSPTRTRTFITSVGERRISARQAWSGRLCSIDSGSRESGRGHANLPTDLPTAPRQLRATALVALDLLASARRSHLALPAPAPTSTCVAHLTRRSRTSAVRPMAQMSACRRTRSRGG